MLVRVVRVCTSQGRHLTDAGFVGTTIRLREIENVIIRNLNFRNPPKGGDLIDIEESTYIWVDHCEFSNDGIVGDKDYYDGMLDIKRASDFITVSWNNFLDHVSPDPHISITGL